MLFLARLPVENGRVQRNPVLASLDFCGDKHCQTVTAPCALANGDSSAYIASSSNGAPKVTTRSGKRLCRCEVGDKIHLVGDPDALPDAFFAAIAGLLLPAGGAQSGAADPASTAGDDG